MCGIAGIISKDKESVRTALERLGASMVHRGPDDSGHSILPLGDHWVGLAFRRLAILDLSPAGHQPMIHPELGNQLIFNGEIYNFQRLRQSLESEGEKFRSTGDTEVILRGLSRFGPDYVSKLHGMFAFAFYSAKEQMLMLARDSAGIKPVYTARSNDYLIFASEVSSILATGLVSPDIDQQAMAGLLAYGCVQHPLTMIKGIKGFAAGHYEIFRGGLKTSSPKQFWTFPTLQHGRSQADLKEEIRSTFDAAVKDHLLSDVPVGVFLSSGLDSTAVAHYAAKYHPRIRSFTVVFSDQPDMSEHVLARKTADRLGLAHEEIEMSGNDCQQACVQWLQSLDQPSVDGLNVYIISEAVRARGITVALSGQGGDELFGGYPSFWDVPSLKRFMRKINFLPRSLRRAAVRAATIGKSHAYREKLLDMASGNGSLLNLYLHRRRAMSDSQLLSLGIDAAELQLDSSFVPLETLQQLPLPDDDVAAVSICESVFYQHNMLLRDGDANSMSHSLEGRVPVLDQRMLDLMHSIPGDQRLPAGAPPKYLMREALAEAYTPELLSQPKKGFSLPIRRWMLGPIRDLCDESVARLKTTGLLKNDGIDQIWNAFLADPESPIWTRAFLLVVAGQYLSLAQQQGRNRCSGIQRIAASAV